MCEEDKFQLQIDTGDVGTIYLSDCGVPGDEAPLLRRILTGLDRAGFRVVGDLAARRHETAMLARIMKTASGGILVLPSQGRSEVIQAVTLEIRTATELKLPLVILEEWASELKARLLEDRTTLELSTGHEVLCLEVRPDLIFLSRVGDGERSLRADGVHELLREFLYCTGSRRPESQPYVFLAARLHNDLALAREAVVAAVENTLGIPCVWFDDPRIATNAHGVRQRTHLLIKHASLVIADLTRTGENYATYSPNTAHEIGMAVAYGRRILLSLQGERRDPYFNAGDLEIIFWKDEEELHNHLAEWLRGNSSALGRRVYNHDIDSDPPATTSLRRRRFAMDESRRYSRSGTQVAPTSKIRCRNSA